MHTCPANTNNRPRRERRLPPDHRQRTETDKGKAPEKDSHHSGSLPDGSKKDSSEDNRNSSNLQLPPPPPSLQPPLQPPYQVDTRSKF